MKHIGGQAAPAGSVWARREAIEGERGPALATAEVPHGARRPRPMVSAGGFQETSNLMGTEMVL